MSKEPVQNKKKQWYLFIGLALLLNCVQAQKKDTSGIKSSQAGIHLIAKAYADSVVLRWGAMSADIWSALNATGYAVRRTSFSNGVRTSVLLTPQAIKPWTLDVMKARLAKDTMAPVAAQALYGKNFGTKPFTGKPSSVLAQRNEQNIRFAFLMLAADWDARIAEAAGLRWVDKNVKPGELYVYEVYPFTPLPQTHVDTGSVAIYNKRETENRHPEGLQLITGDKKIILSWLRPTKSTYSGYFIEKSSDGGKTFKRLNSKPYLPPATNEIADKTKTPGGIDINKYTMYTDSVHENYKTYKYRIAGINSFGETCGWSDTLSASARDLTPPAAPKILPPVKLGGRSIKISWSKKTFEPDFAGYYVSRTRDGKKFELLTPLILDKAQTSFIDTAAYIHGLNYYYVLAFDTARNYSVSSSVAVSLPDSTPPAAPAGLKGKIDKKGCVVIHWNANTDEDIKGYKIYYANSDKHAFIPRVNRNLAQPVFYDTIPLVSLTTHIYYRVKAIDTHDNLSAFSEILDLNKPDITPPALPVIKHMTMGSRKVTMQVMEGTPENASGYLVYRKVKDKDKDWKQTAKIKQYQSNYTFSFTDSGLRSKTTYLYCVEAINGDSLSSGKCLPHEVTYYSRHQEPKINTLVAKYDHSTNSIKLQWKYEATSDYSFIVYRSGGGDMEQLQTLARTSSTYVDNHLDKTTKLYRYNIQAIFNDKREETALGAPVKVSIK